MRNRLLVVAGAVALAGLLSATARAQDSSKPSWRVGYSEADITPPLGQVAMYGYGRERYAKGTLSPLLTQVVVLRDHAGHTGVLIAADIGGFERVMTEAIRRAIARKHHIPAANVMLAASHSHWTPVTRFHEIFAIGAPNVWYMDVLEGKILASVDTAMGNLSPASIEYDAIDFRGIGCNRRLIRGGRVYMSPNPEGSFDGHTPILRIRREGSPAQVLLVGHACHPTSSGPIEQWSPDYPGAMRDRLSSELTDTKAMFLQGCGGDAKVVHRDAPGGKIVFCNDPEHSKAAGQNLAKAVMDRLNKGEMTPLSGALRCSLTTGQLSYGRRWTQEEIERTAYSPKRDYRTWKARQSLAMPDRSESFRYDVQVWLLGHRLTLFGMEGEICSPWGPMLRQMARTEHAMVVGYVTEVDTYIPDKRIVREGGYEGRDAKEHLLPGPFTEQIDDEIKQIATRALDAVEVTKD